MVMNVLCYSSRDINELHEYGWRRLLNSDANYLLVINILRRRRLRSAGEKLNGNQKKWFTAF